MRKPAYAIFSLAVGALMLSTGAALAGAGWGEQPPVQFKSPNEVQVDLNKERTRQEYNALKGAGIFDDLNGGLNGGNGGNGGNGIGGGLISGNAQSAANSLNDSTSTNNVTIQIDGEGNEVIVQTYQEQNQDADDISQTNLNSQVTGQSPIEILNE